MNAQLALFAGDAVPLEARPDEDVLRAAEAGAVFTFSLSGGKDGLAAADAVIRMLDAMGHPRDRRFAIHADLGRTEWKSTPTVVEAQARHLGLPLIVVRRPEGDLVSVWEQRYADGLPAYARLEQIRLRGPWSSSSQLFCRSSTKRDQIVKELRRRFPNELVVCVIGVRRDESAKRASAALTSWEKKLSTPGRTKALNWNAIVDWLTPDVFAYADANGLPMHEGYSRWGVSRISCALCVLQSRGDRDASLANPENHDLYRTLVGIEATTGFSFQQQSWLCDARPDLLDEDTLTRSVAAKAYSTERRRLEALVDDAFVRTPKGSSWPHRMPDDDEARAIAEARRLVSSWTGLDLPHLDASSVKDRFAAMIAG